MKRLSPSKQKFGMVPVLQVLLDQVGQQLFEHHGGVFHPSLQRRHEEGGHVTAVPHGERPLSLQRVNEGQQEHLVVQKLTEQTQGFLHISRRLRREFQDLFDRNPHVAPNPKTYFFMFSLS